MRDGNTVGLAAALVVGVALATQYTQHGQARRAGGGVAYPPVWSGGKRQNAESDDLDRRIRAMYATTSTADIEAMLKHASGGSGWSLRDELSFRRRHGRYAPRLGRAGGGFLVNSDTRLSIRPQVHRGRSGFLITGTARGRPNQRVWLPTRAKAEAYREAMRADNQAAKDRIMLGDRRAGGGALSRTRTDGGQRSDDTIMVRNGRHVEVWDRVRPDGYYITWKMRGGRSLREGDLLDHIRDLRERDGKTRRAGGGRSGRYTPGQLYSPCSHGNEYDFCPVQGCGGRLGDTGRAPTRDEVDAQQIEAQERAYREWIGSSRQGRAGGGGVWSQRELDADALRRDRGLDTNRKYTASADPAISHYIYGHAIPWWARHRGEVTAAAGRRGRIAGSPAIIGGRPQVSVDWITVDRGGNRHVRSQLVPLDSLLWRRS